MICRCSICSFILFLGSICVLGNLSIDEIGTSSDIDSLESTGQVKFASAAVSVFIGNVISTGISFQQAKEEDLLISEHLKTFFAYLNGTSVTGGDLQNFCVYPCCDSSYYVGHSADSFAQYLNTRSCKIPKSDCNAIIDEPGGYCDSGDTVVSSASHHLPPYPLFVVVFALLLIFIMYDAK